MTGTVFLFSGCSHETAAPVPAPPSRAEEQDILVAAPGLVEPVTEEFKIGSELAGKLHEVLVEEGDHVEQGQIIATLEDAEYQARVRSAEAELEQRQAELDRLVSGARAEEREIAKLQLEEAQAVLHQPDVERKRREQLYKMDDIRVDGLLSFVRLQKKNSYELSKNS